MVNSPLPRTLKRLRGAFWRRRFARGVVRSLWITLLVPTVVMAGYLWLGWQTVWFEWLTVALAVGSLSLLWSLRPIGLKQMTRNLDRLLGARARLITAYEISQPAAGVDSNPVADQLVQDAVNLSIEARRQVRLLGHGFWLETRALIAVAAIMGAMLLLDALTPNIPNATPIDLPVAGVEPQADELDELNPQLQPPPFQQPPALSPQQAQAALEALAEALRDQAVTRAAAEAIERGDLAGAGQELRRVADQLEGLSDSARDALAEALQSAAEAMGGEVPGFTEPLQQGSQGLSRDDLSQAGEALEVLAETLERLGETAPSQQPAADGQSGQENGEAEAAENQEPGETDSGQGDGSAGGEGGESNDGLAEEAERLPIDGEPLELQNEAEPGRDERVLQPAELDADADGRRTTDSPFARRPLNATGEELGADTLTYPWEQRDVVRQYFTP
jgi:predicted  nucleic acid-binding Zn-ribbon protein